MSAVGAASTWAEAFATDMDALYARLNPGAPKTPREAGNGGAVKRDAGGPAPRPEVVAGPCDTTWPASIRDDLGRYRQHRCGQDAPHPNRPCVCRYCEQKRSGGRWPQ